MNDKDLPGVTNDNPNLPDEDDAAAVEAERTLLLQNVLGEEVDEAPGDDTEQAPAQTAPEKSEAAQTESEQTPPAQTQAPQTQAPPAEDRLFTQADLERIIGERLGRDRKVQTIRQLESVAGQPIEELVQAYRVQQVERAQEQYAMTEDEARTYVTQQEELRSLKAQQEAMRQQQEAMQAMMAYQQEKQRHLQQAPLARQYEREIDDFSGMGAHLPFEAAMAYILGQKVLSGEVLQNVRQAAEAQTLANVQKRRAAAPEAATAGGGPANEGLTPQERVIAARLGLTAKEYQESRQRIQKSRAQRG